ncbi:hypothetical protein BEH94_01220 [Candidatus Altiarchaeales archaeon WOR_SM1_SCG]|nr:hypothetical protein BEH94_01220 [Candidatus Altiarchaeales archaeon WOR_SM1_SCG]
MERMEMNIICLDSDVVVDYLRGREPVKSELRELINSGKIITITSITIYELYLGANLSKNPGKETEKLDNLRVYLQEIEFNSIAAEIAGETDAHLKKSGMQVDLRDVLIASVCIANKIPLFTKNASHFSRIRGLELYENF